METTSSKNYQEMTPTYWGRIKARIRSFEVPGIFNEFPVIPASEAIFDTAYCPQGRYLAVIVLRERSSVIFRWSDTIESYLRHSTELYGYLALNGVNKVMVDWAIMRTPGFTTFCKNHNIQVQAGTMKMYEAERAISKLMKNPRPEGIYTMSYTQLNAL